MRLCSNLLICFFGYLLLIAGLGSGPVRAQEKTAPKTTLAELAFIAGTWQGELGKGTTEEQWNPPSGDSMMGMFRYVQNGKAAFYQKSGAVLQSEPWRASARSGLVGGEAPSTEDREAVAEGNQIGG